MSRLYRKRIEEIQTPLKLDQLTRNLKSLQTKLERAKKEGNKTLIELYTDKINSISRDIITRRNKILDYLFEDSHFFDKLSIEQLLKKEAEIESILSLKNLNENKYTNILNKIKESIKSKSKLRNLESFISSEMTIRSPVFGRGKNNDSIESDSSENSPTKTTDEKTKNLVDSSKIPIPSETDGTARIDDIGREDDIHSSTRSSQNILPFEEKRTSEEISKMNEFFSNLKMSAQDTSRPKLSREGLTLDLDDKGLSSRRRRVTFSDLQTNLSPVKEFHDVGTKADNAKEEKHDLDRHVNKS